jgi:hypothetical protein
LISVVFLSVVFLMSSSCGPSRPEIAQRQRDRELWVSSQTKNDQTNEEDVALARRLEIASMVTLPVTPLTSPELVEDYSTRLADLHLLVLAAEHDALIHSARSHWRLHVQPGLNRAKEALASGMITKGKAELAMNDFETARKTLRRVVVEFDSPEYGSLRRQAEVTLEDVEREAKRAQGPRWQ